MEWTVFFYEIKNVAEVMETTKTNWFTGYVERTPYRIILQAALVDA